MKSENSCDMYIIILALYRRYLNFSTFSIPETDVALKAISRRTGIEHLTLIYDSPDIYTLIQRCRRGEHVKGKLFGIVFDPSFL